jgi:hypothetical protein
VFLTSFDEAACEHLSIDFDDFLAVQLLLTPVRRPAAHNHLHALALTHGEEG